MTDIAKIAAGLTPMQHKDLERLPCRSGRTISVRLLRSPLVKRRRLFWLFGPHYLFLTRTGLAVRDYLRKQNDG